MKVHVELSFPPHNPSDDIANSCSRFETFYKESTGVHGDVMKLLRAESSPNSISLVYELSSPDALRSALEIGEKVSGLSLPSKRTPYIYDFLRTARLRVLARKSCSQNSAPAEWRKGLSPRLPRLVNLVQQSIDIMRMDPVTDSVDCCEAEQSVLVESFMVDLTTENQDPIFISGSRPKLTLARIPPFTLVRAFTREIGLQTAEHGQLSDTLDRVVVPDKDTTHEASCEKTESRYEQDFLSPVSIRPVRKQGKDLWDND